MSGSGIPQPQSDLTETAMSRSIKFVKAGGPEVLEFVEVQVPAPGPNEVRIKVKAIGINRAEAIGLAGMLGRHRRTSPTCRPRRRSRLAGISTPSMIGARRRTTRIGA